MRILKFLIALLLLPACAAVTMSAWHEGRLLLLREPGVAAAVPSGTTSFPVPRDGRHYIISPAAAFWAGYGLWLAIFALLPKPTRTYVLGHELTHAFWALLMGARVSGLKVRKTSGQVKLSKTNWFITLAPYFFPFYAMLFIAGFLLAHTVWNLGAYMWLMFFLIGVGWSFHVTFTIMMLLNVSQPDIVSQGRLFSLVAIYCMNLLTIAVTIAALSPKLTIASLSHALGRDLALAYGWTLDSLIGLWQHARAFFRRTT